MIPVFLKFMGQCGQFRTSISRGSSSVVSKKYHEKIIGHYENPRKVGSLPKDDKNVGTGLVHNLKEGDMVQGKETEILGDEKEAQGIKIPIGCAGVKEMIATGFYADRTDYIAKLFRGSGSFYFFIRPRRFGKSLLLDTIDQIAQGNRELFKDCLVYQNAAVAHEWKEYPVILLNFSKLPMGSPEKLENNLMNRLYRMAEKYSIDRSKIDPIIGKPTVEGILENLIDGLKKLGPGYEPEPIILIDKYDSPLISSEKGQYAAVLSVLSSVFRVLKGSQKDCKFIFVTGVTGFHVPGLTSGANSMHAIWNEDDYSAMLGFTEKDIDHLFLSKQSLVKSVLQELPPNQRNGEKHTKSILKEALRAYYNGYCFTRKGTLVYNPDSILKFFGRKMLSNYWFNTGSPSILLQQMRDQIHRFIDIDWDKDSFVITQVEFENTATSLHTIKLLPLMYQTGYLTLDPHGYKKDTTEIKYYLKFPNQEVKESLQLKLEEISLEEQEQKGRNYGNRLIKLLFEENWIEFFNIIRHRCISDAGYMTLDGSEYSFQNRLHAFLQGAVFSQAMELILEDMSSNGRSDLVLKDNQSNKVYIFELKVNNLSQVALNQIYDHAYYEKYVEDYSVFLIGLNCTYRPKSNQQSSHRTLESCSIGIRNRGKHAPDNRHFTYCKTSSTFQEAMIEEVSCKS